MASLVLCIVCQRHVRRQEAQCPFCGAERTPSASPVRAALIPCDAKRATIFALGLALAGQACGGQSEGVNDPAPSGTGASVGKGGSSGTSLGGSGGGSSNNPGNVPGNLTPPYGLSIPFPLPDEVGGSSGSIGMPDATSPPEPAEDAGAEDAGNGTPEDAGG